MTERGWYLRCSADEIGERAVLVGDRGRVAVAAALLDNPKWLNEDRGLTTVSGDYRGERITVSAFGMGAPIAAVVLHELARLGVRTLIRLGTAIALPGAPLGSLLLADGAVRGEAVSTTYQPLGYPAVPDAGYNATVRTVLGEQEWPWTGGLMATYDGFYTQMFPVEPERADGINRSLDDLARSGVVAVDMETSAVFVVGRTLGVRTASLCLLSAAAKTHAKLSDEEREKAEAALIQVGLDSLARA